MQNKTYFAAILAHAILVNQQINKHLLDYEETSTFFMCYKVLFIIQHFFNLFLNIVKARILSTGMRPDSLTAQVLRKSTINRFARPVGVEVTCTMLSMTLHDLG